MDSAIIRDNDDPSRTDFAQESRSTKEGNGDRDFVPGWNTSDSEQEISVGKAKKSATALVVKSSSKQNPASRAAAKQLSATEDGSATKESRSKTEQVKEHRQSILPSKSPAPLEAENQYANKRQRVGTNGTATVDMTDGVAGAKSVSTADTRKQKSNVDPNEQSSYAEGQPSLPHNRDHPKARLESYAAADISKELNDIWTLIQSSAQALFKATKVDPESLAAVAGRPNVELEVLYKKLFGGDTWRKRIHRILQSRTANCRDLLAGCIAAGVFEAFDQPSPWASAKAEVEKLELTAKSADTILKASGKFISLQALLGEAVQAKVKTQEFEKTVIWPKATAHVQSLNLALNGQLEAVGAMFPVDKAGIDRFWDDRDNAMVRIMAKALILKSRMLAARDEHQKPRWIQSGESFDPDEMEEMREGKGSREVAWCVSPLVRMKLLEGGEYEVACKAKVFTRKTIRG